MKIRPLFLLMFFLIIAVLFVLIPSKFQFSSEKTAEVMGTTVRVKINGQNAPQLVEEVLSEIKRLDKILTRFEKRSEVSLINYLAGKAPVEVSPDTLKVVEMAVQVNRRSQGAFDITLGHPQDLIIDKKLRKVYLRKAGNKIDLGGIGKGYAVESARRLLLKEGVKSAIIDMHSSIAVIGNNWRIGIVDPRSEGRGLPAGQAGAKDVLGVVFLNDGDALSTSGNYEQPRHIIDPRTGKVADKCLSVTVIAKDAGLADALSTAVFVLGPIDGMKLAKSLSAVKAVIVDNKGIIYDNFGFKLR